MSAVPVGRHGEGPIGSSPSFAEAAGVWHRIGWTSFGGPAGQIALMHRVLVDERRWLTEREFLRALGFCMLLPGPEAMQLATYAGWRLHGVRGGLVAGGLFVLPGSAIVLGLAVLYAAAGRVPIAQSALLGVKAAALVLVFEAVLRLGRRALTRRRSRWIAVASFVATHGFGVPFPALVLASGIVGAAWPHRRDAADSPSVSRFAATPLATARTIGWGLVIWLAPLVCVAASLGPAHVLTQMAWFFSRLAVVTFGGAYAALAYMSQDVVARYGWLSPSQMLDGLGLAETTPGPLILVNLFVGYLAGHGSATGPGIGLGLAGAGVALWATFAPCFLWIFAGAPYLDWLTSQRRLESALSAITATVLGVIANLAVWFAIHALFGRASLVEFGALRVLAPVVSTLDGRAFALAAGCSVLAFRWHWSVHRLLLAAVVGSLVWSIVRG